METSPNKTGIIYCRVSSAEQVDGTSLDSQRKICTDYARKQNIDIVEFFIEKGESAKTTDRPEFIKAIAHCRKNKVSFFIVYKLDRFARNWTDYGIVRRELQGSGTVIKSVTENIDDSAAGEALEGILSVFAQFDNRIRTERSVSGMRERLKQGIWVWSAPLGYKRLEKGANLSIDEKTAPLVRIIFEEYSKGIYTYESLADHIYSIGLRSKNGEKIYKQHIEKILKNPIYYGIMRAFKLEFKGEFEPIISYELFESCQDRKRIKARNNSPRTAKNPHFSLRRLCTCDLCNRPLTASRATNHAGVKYAYYHHQKQDCKNAKFIPAKDFEQKFAKYLNEITPDTKYEKIFKEIVIDIWQTNYKKLDEENAKTRREVERLEAERQKIFDLHRSGIYSDDDFITQKLLINTKIDQKYRLLGDKRIEEFNMEEALSYCFDLVRKTSAKWLDFEYPERVRFQKMIFDGNVVFDGEKFGTTKLSSVYKLNQEYDGKKSNLVTLQRIEL